MHEVLRLRSYKMISEGEVKMNRLRRNTRMRVCLINESYSLTLTVLFMSETNTSTVNFNIMSMVNDVL